MATSERTELLLEPAGNALLLVFRPCFRILVPGRIREHDAHKLQRLSGIRHAPLKRVQSFDVAPYLVCPESSLNFEGADRTLAMPSDDITSSRHSQGSGDRTFASNLAVVFDFPDSHLKPNT